MTARWGVLVIVAALAGGWSGAVVGQPTTPVAQTSGTSGSGGGASSGADGDGTSGASGAGEPGPGGDAEDDTGGGGGEPTDDTTSDPAAAPPAVEPPAETIPEDRVAEGEPTDCGPEARCYTVDDADAEGVRVPDGQGGFVVVPIVAVPVVDVDTGASTSAASNVDLQVRVDNSSGDVRIERRVAGSTQLVYVTLAALVGLFVGAAVLGTFLRFRRGPVS